MERKQKEGEERKTGCSDNWEMERIANNSHGNEENAKSKMNANTQLVCESPLKTILSPKISQKQKHNAEKRANVKPLNKMKSGKRLNLLKRFEVHIHDPALIRLHTFCSLSIYNIG